MYLTKLFIEIRGVALGWLVGCLIVELNVPDKEQAPKELLEFQSDIQRYGNNIVEEDHERQRILGNSQS